MLGATTAKNSVIFQETAQKETKRAMLLVTTVRRRDICPEIAKAKDRRLVTSATNRVILQEIAKTIEIK